MGLEHKNYLAYPPCTTAESHKSYCLLGPLYQQSVSQFELFIHVFGHCWYQHWRQVFLSTKVCCNDHLIPQSHELVEICLSHCKILYQSEIFVVIFLEKIEFYTQVNGIIFGPRKSSISVLAFAKVHIVVQVSLCKEAVVW